MILMRSSVGIPLTTREWIVIAARLGLTSRESAITRLVLDGVSDVEIATRLSIARATVHAHLARLYLKLDIHSRYQLVLRAFEAYISCCVVRTAELE
jgi:DNA-binding NarL/FixJ family response regulator